MTEQNGRLMKSFSQLEKLLNDMYGRQEGKGSVTVYIDLMKEKQQTDRDVYDVDDWEEDLRSLKNIRYKRNKIAHESDAMDADMCDEEDVLWLENFRERVMRGTDPLAQLTRMKEQQRIYEESLARARKQSSTPLDAPEYNGNARGRSTENAPSEWWGWFILIVAAIVLIYCFVSK